MTREEKIAVLHTTARCTADEAERILGELEGLGFTIYLKKVQHVERAANVSTPMTPALRRMIRQAYQSNPDVPLQDLAHTYNVNIGRVSEALR